MKKNPGKTSLHRPKKGVPEKNNLQGYPTYPDDEDIYGMYLKEKNINPEDTSKNIKTTDIALTRANNEKDFDDDLSGSDLDIPGSEQDEESESTGIEDEENNYFSLGGDGHSDLDENTLELNP
jgi:hypothetical protein